MSKWVAGDVIVSDATISIDRVCDTDFVEDGVEYEILIDGMNFGITLPEEDLIQICPETRLIHLTQRRVELDAQIRDLEKRDK